jgi:hypothetical protein
MATRSYEWFLRLPVPLILIVLWLAGAALGVAGAALGVACAVTLYEVGSVLVQ